MTRKNSSTERIERHSRTPGDCRSGGLVLTEGGEEIRPYREVKQAGDVVRRYSADGTLYAYRDGDEHVVVLNGRDRADQWTKRVPAERTTVEVGEQLWTIPENWDHRLSIRGPAEHRDALYHIPETGRDVRVTVPHRNQLCDAWYGVQEIGTVVVEWEDDEVDQDALRRLLEDNAGEDVIDGDVLSALDRIDQQWERFVDRYREAVDEFAWDAFWDGPDWNDGWTREPWSECFWIDGLLARELGVDESVASETDELLRNEGVIPNYPTLRVSIQED